MEMKLTPNQKKLLKYHAKKADMEYEPIAKRVEEWTVTITEIINWILWTRPPLYPKE